VLAGLGPLAPSHPLAPAVVSGTLPLAAGHGASKASHLPRPGCLLTWAWDKVLSAALLLFFPQDEAFQDPGAGQITAGASGWVSRSIWVPRCPPAPGCVGLVSCRVPPFPTFPAPAAAAPPFPCPVALTRLLGPSHTLPAAYLGKGWGLGLLARSGGVFFCTQGLCTAAGKALLAVGPLPPAPRFGLDQAPSLPSPSLPPCAQWSWASQMARTATVSAGPARGKALSWCLRPGSQHTQLWQHPQGAGSCLGPAGLAQVGNGRPMWIEELVSSLASPCLGSVAASALPSLFPALVP